MNITEYLQKVIAELTKHKILNEWIRVNEQEFCDVPDGEFRPCLKHFRPCSKCSHFTKQNSQE